MNAPVSSDIELRPQAGSDRAFMWVCTDFSEGNEDGETETYAVKFKTPEIANEFKEAYEKAISGAVAQVETAPDGTPMTRAEAQAFVAALAGDGDGVKSSVDTYVAKHGVNTPSADGFTLLHYAVAKSNEEAVNLLVKCPGVNLEVKGGKLWNFAWEETFILDGLHDETFMEEMEDIDSGMTAFMLAAACGSKAVFETILSSKGSLKGQSGKFRDVRDFIKLRYDSEGAKHALNKLIAPSKELRKASVDTTTAAPSAAAPAPTPAAVAAAPAAAADPSTGFKFSSTPSFNFSWGKAAEEKKKVLLLLVLLHTADITAATTTILLLLLLLVTTTTTTTHHTHEPRTHTRTHAHTVHQG